MAKSSITNTQSYDDPPAVNGVSAFQPSATETPLTGPAPARLHELHRDRCNDRTRYRVELRTPDRERLRRRHDRYPSGSADHAADRRFTIAAVALAGIALAVRAPWPHTWAGWRDTVVAGLLLQGVSFAGTYLGLALGLPAGLAALILGLSPLTVALAGGPLLGERLAGRQWLGSALGIRSTGTGPNRFPTVASRFSHDAPASYRNGPTSTTHAIVTPNAVTATSCWAGDLGRSHPLEGVGVQDPGSPWPIETWLTRRAWP